MTPLPFLAGLSLVRIRRPEWRPIATGLSVLAAADVALPHLPDVATVAVHVAWPGALAAVAWAVSGNRRPAAVVAPFAAYAAHVVHQLPLATTAYADALRSPRVAALSVVATLAALRPRRPVSGPEIAAALLAVEQAAQLVARWAEPWNGWTVARIVTGATYAAVAAIIIRG